MILSLLLTIATPYIQSPNPYSLGTYIKYDPRSESYLLDPVLQLRLPVKDTVLCLCELGWLYAKVAAYIQAADNRYFNFPLHYINSSLTLYRHLYVNLSISSL